MKNAYLFLYTFKLKVSRCYVLFCGEPRTDNYQIFAHLDSGGPVSDDLQEIDSQILDLKNKALEIQVIVTSTQEEYDRIDLDTLDGHISNASGEHICFEVFRLHFVLIAVRVTLLVGLTAL